MSREGLMAWFGEHLSHVCSQAQLGVVCAGLGIDLWQVAPGQLAPEERIDLLLEHLIETRQLSAFGRALLSDVSVGAEARRLGLADVVPQDEARVVSGQTRSGEQKPPPDAGAVETLVAAFHSRLAGGDPLGAYDILTEDLGGFEHLFCRLGRTQLFLELLRKLCPDLAARALQQDEAAREKYAQLLRFETEALRVTGQLEAALLTTQRQWPFSWEEQPELWLAQARIQRLSGRLRHARRLAQKAQTLSPKVSVQGAAAAELSHLALLLGDTAMCLLHLRQSLSLWREAGRAEKTQDFWPIRLEILRAARALRLQDVTQARTWLEQTLVRAEQAGDLLSLAETRVLLADALRRDGEHQAAAQQWAEAMQFASSSGAAEILCAAGREETRLLLEQNKYEAAAATLGTALAMAEELMLGCCRIDLLNLRGHLALRRSNTAQAEEDARNALALSMSPECGYAWGEADSLHLLAVTLLSSRPQAQSLRHNEAISHLSDELELRDRMQDPTAPEVRWLIRRLRTFA